MGCAQQDRLIRRRVAVGAENSHFFCIRPGSATTHTAQKSARIITVQRDWRVIGLQRRDRHQAGLSLVFCHGFQCLARHSLRWTEFASGRSAQSAPAGATASHLAPFFAHSASRSPDLGLTDVPCSGPDLCRIQKGGTHDIADLCQLTPPNAVRDWSFWPVIPRFSSSTDPKNTMPYPLRPRKGGSPGPAI